MLFNDQLGFVVVMSSLLMVERYKDIDKGGSGYGIRYVTLQGIQGIRFYSGKDARNSVYSRCVQEWSDYHQKGDYFDDFMRDHAVKGARLAEERAEDGKKGWE